MSFLVALLRLWQLGSTAIGIQTSEGVCLAVEKRITSPLMEPNSIEKIVEIDAHIGNAPSVHPLGPSTARFYFMFFFYMLI